MVNVTGTFKIRRYWLAYNIPQDVIDTLNVRIGTYISPLGIAASGRTYYVDINYYGESDRDLTLMELRYADYILDREEIVYTVEGDDGLGEADDSK